MKLEMDDLKHCHKVLSSDIEECRILGKGSTGGRADRLQKRIEDDLRVISRIERILGCVPEYEYIANDEEH